MEFGRKLKKLRLEKGVSQQKLADMIFVSRSAVAKWENGLGLPSEESLAALAKFFGVPQAFFQTDRPEEIVIEKNRKIKKISASMGAVIMGAAVLLIAYMLFRPVPYYASAGWDRIEVQPVSESAPFVITDKSEVEAFVDLLNSVNFRKSLRISNGAPDHLQAVFYGRDEDGADIWLCAAADNRFSVYVWNGTEELAACSAEELGGYMARLMEEPHHRGDGQ